MTPRDSVILKYVYPEIRLGEVMMGAMLMSNLIGYDGKLTLIAIRQAEEDIRKAQNDWANLG